jgi:parvulin-like peptidyl-prolyl isomerase
MKAGSMDQISLRRRSKLLVTLVLAGLVAGMARAQAPAPPAAGTQSAPSKPPAPTAQPSESPDKVVLKVGDEQFTKADLDFLVENLNPQAQRILATRGRKELGDQFARLVMLAQQAHSHNLDQTPAFQQKLAVQKQQLQAQAAYEEIVQQAKVSPEEISQYYSAHLPEFDEVTVRQFVVRKRAVNAQTGPGLAAEEAKTRAEAMRKEVAAGTDVKKVTEDFKAPGDVIIEPEPRDIRRGSMRPELEKAVFALKDGEVSEVLDIPQALVFFQVTGHGRVELKNASTQIEETLRKEKVDAAMEDLKKKAVVWMDDQYFAPATAPQPGVAPGVSTSKPPEKP